MRGQPEVLKYKLLGFLADDASLQPRDIVVMAPDIAAYASHLPAVFGEPARYSADPAQIPWHLADVALARTHPLFTGFAKLLDLGESRFRVSDVLDLLDVPAIARRFGLDDDAQSRLEPWLRRARVAWGLDASMKEHAGAAPVDANTWSFGFDRLYAGMIVGNEASAQTIDTISPVAGVSGNDIDAIGRLDRFIETLRRLRTGFAIERPLAAWSTWLQEMLDALFAIDIRDDKEDADAMDALRQTLVSLVDQVNAIGAQNLPWHVVRDAVRSALDTVSDHQPFLLGGVTFCGLVPQRSIPFRAVCLLGMNEGDYPRIANDGGLNRMQSQPRRGDRDTRNEDRYLFLEAVMAARSHLHISYIGEDVGDGSTRNPASPLAELLDFLDEQFDLTDARKNSMRPWIVRHPLQPFDARYYTGGDERLFSFDRSFVTKPDLLVEKNPFIGTVGDDVESPSFDADVSLKSLKTFWRDPAEASLRDAFGIGLDALGDDAPTDSEPLSASVEKRERLESQLLSEAMRAGAMRLATEAPVWLANSGVLPAGDVGARAYARVRERAQAMLDAVLGCLGSDSRPIDQPIDFPLDSSLRIVGVIDRVFRTADGSLRLLHAKPSGIADFRDLLPFYIDYALLRLTSRAPITAEFFDYHETAAQRVQTPELCRSILAQSDAQLTTGLHELSAMMRHAARTPPFLFPKTTWASLKSSSERRDIDARNAWEGSSFRKGERDFEPGYAALVARDTDFLKHSTPGYEEFEATNAWIGNILDPSRNVLRRAARGSA